MRNITVKKIFALLLTLMMTLAFFGCGGLDKAKEFSENVYEVTATGGATRTASAIAVENYGDGALLITNYHVVMDGESVTVGNKQAEILGYSTYHDLAVLKASGIKVDNPAEFSKDYDGNHYTIGNLAGEGVKVYEGKSEGLTVIVTAKLRGSGNKYVPVIDTTSESGQGMSGGACLNDDGKIIGVTTYGDTGDGIGSVVPGVIAEAVLNAVKNGGQGELDLYGEEGYFVKMLSENELAYLVDARGNLHDSGFKCIVQLGGLYVTEAGKSCQYAEGELITEFAGVNIEGKKSILPVFSALLSRKNP
ncbi:MAG: serine protease [Clostridia bacterium]|nr:serine protease [Clostridia bacterium]